jgi:hypothetical protein
MLVRSFLSSTTTEGVAREGEMSCTVVDIGSESLVMVREEEFEGAGFSHRGWRDFQVEDGAEVVWGDDWEFGAAEWDIGEFGTHGDLRMSVRTLSQ